MSFIAYGCLLLGVGLFCLAALGTIRLPDTLSRMHAASKGSSLGLFLILFGCVLLNGSLEVATRAILIIVFIFLTLPVATHLLAKAQLRRQETLGERSETA